MQIFLIALKVRVKNVKILFFLGRCYNKKRVRDDVNHVNHLDLFVLQHWSSATVLPRGLGACQGWIV